MLCLYLYLYLSLHLYLHLPISISLYTNAKKRYSQDFTSLSSPPQHSTLPSSLSSFSAQCEAILSRFSSPMSTMSSSISSSSWAALTQLELQAMLLNVLEDPTTGRTSMMSSQEHQVPTIHHHLIHFNSPMGKWAPLIAIGKWEHQAVGYQRSSSALDVQSSTFVST